MTVVAKPDQLIVSTTPGTSIRCAASSFAMWLVLIGPKLSRMTGHRMRQRNRLSRAGELVRSLVITLAVARLAMYAISWVGILHIPEAITTGTFIAFAVLTVVFLGAGLNHPPASSR